MKNLIDILQQAGRHRASDLIIKAGSTPRIRVQGKIIDLPQAEVITLDDLLD